jgi:hypothetical protein
MLMLLFFPGIAQLLTSGTGNSILFFCFRFFESWANNHLNISSNGEACHHCGGLLAC